MCFIKNLLSLNLMIQFFTSRVFKSRSRGCVPIAEMGPLPPKVCKTPQSFNIGVFENFKSLSCLKSNLETILLVKIFLDFELESGFFSIFEIVLHKKRT